MENDPPLNDIDIAVDPYEGPGDSSRDVRIDDYRFDEQEDEDEHEIQFGRTDPTPVPNVFQQAWGYGQSTPLFDRSRRRSFIDPLRQSTSPSLFGALPPLRPWRTQPVAPPMPPPAQPQPLGNNQPIVQPPAQPTSVPVQPIPPPARAATAAPPAATGPPPTRQATRPPTQTSFILNGEVLLIGQSRQAAPTTSDCLFKKEDRASLPADERHKIIEEATTKSKLPKFKPLQLAMAKNKGGKDKDSELLKEDANLHAQIRSIEARHRRYDLHTPFTIVFPDDCANSPRLTTDGSTILTVDLFRMYLSVTPYQVGISNAWYNTWTDPVQQPWHRENLQLSYLMLQEHTEHNLHTKILEIYDKYADEYKGGPLYFKLLMDFLVSDLQSVADSIIKHIQSYKIRDVKGEDVSVSVTLLRNGCDRLHSVHRLPNDMPRTLVQVFQTTSNGDFNRYFAAAEIDIRRDPLSQRRDQYAVHHYILQNSGSLVAKLQDQIKEECEKLLEDADREYTSSLYQGSWRIPKANNDATALLANIPAGGQPFSQVHIFKAAVLLAGLNCWNCGGTDHKLTKCPHPKNDKQVEANRKAWNEAKAKSGDGTSKPKSGNKDRSRSKKWAPPGKGEGPKRTIDGKPMFWNRGSKRWVPDKDADQANLAEDGDEKPTKKKPKAKSKVKKADSDSDEDSASDDSDRALLADSVETFGSAMRNIATLLDKVKNKTK